MTSVSPRAKRRVLECIQGNALRPTELLQKTELQDLSYRDLQDALASLLESGEVQLDSDRRLRVPQVAV